MSGTSARAAQTQSKQIKPIEAIYVFHVGDTEVASVRQLAETARNKTTYVAREIGMVIHSFQPRGPDPGRQEERRGATRA